MKKIATKIFSILFAVVIIFECGAAPASAAFSDFTDIKVGHWAYSTLQKAYNDGLIGGYPNKTLGPNRTISLAEMITILSHVLKMDKSANLSSLGLSGKEWYAAYAGQALYLGIISQGVKLNQPMTRQNAMVMMAKAFQLIEADPDTSSLDKFSDSYKLSGEARRAIAVLVNHGYIAGDAGSLMLSKEITRAEFIKILYNVINDYAVSGDTLRSGNNYLLSGDSGALSLAGIRLGNIWTACNVESVSLNNVQAGRFVVRAYDLNVLNIANRTSIDRLVLANSSGDIALSPDDSSSITTAAVGDGAGKVTMDGNIQNAEVTGSKRTVLISTSMDSLIISGNNNTVTINAGASIESVIITGTGNTVKINGTVGELTIRGKTSVSGTGSADRVLSYVKSSTISIRYNKLEDKSNYGLEFAELSLSLPDTLPVGQKLTASVTITGAQEGATYTGYWYVDGVQKSYMTITSNKTVSFSYSYTYTKNMAKTSTIRFVLKGGNGQERSVQGTFKVQNYSASYYDESPAQVLKTVKTGYAGNYTLAWAESHDYTKKVKEVWINAKGYSSSTKYLLWINTTYQRVNVFQGSKGSWSLIHSYIVATGASDTPTPVGVYTTTYKQTGWWTSTYTVYPVVRFKQGSGYAFHSRLYKPGSTSILNDARIGFPISHGCVRMYNPDLQWIYDNIPTNTTVVVF